VHDEEKHHPNPMDLSQLSAGSPFWRPTPHDQEGLAFKSSKSRKHTRDQLLGVPALFWFQHNENPPAAVAHRASGSKPSEVGVASFTASPGPS
jgi:hypothetical protein